MRVRKYFVHWSTGRRMIFSTRASANQWAADLKAKRYRKIAIEEFTVWCEHLAYLNHESDSELLARGIERVSAAAA